MPLSKLHLLSDELTMPDEESESDSDDDEVESEVVPDPASEAVDEAEPEAAEAAPAKRVANDGQHTSWGGKKKTIDTSNMHMKFWDVLRKTTRMESLDGKERQSQFWSSGNISGSRVVV